MTEYELTDSLTSLMSVASDIFAVYISLLAAYLVSVYLVGYKLGATQVITISTLFAVAGSVMIWGMYTFFSRAIPLVDALEVINPDGRYGAHRLTRFVLVSVMSMGILACLQFMWDIRRGKTD
jgi:hypothetical protein